jgi:diguanylate cyclase (GGDEF)-like protein/PAS domain S-box-containing protein
MMLNRQVGKGASRAEPAHDTLITIAFKLLGFAAIYALAYKLPLIFFAPKGNGSPFFLASGLALAALLIGGKKYASGIFLGAFLINHWNGSSLPVQLGMALASTSGAMLGAWLLKRDEQFDPSLQTLPDFLKLAVFSGALGSALSALMGSTTLLLSGFFNTGNYLEKMIYWWTGDMLGVLIFAPLILTWHKTSWFSLDKRHLPESLLIIGLSILVGQIEFLGWFHDSIGHLAKGYWMFLVIVWVAVRLNTQGTTVVLFIATTQAAAGAYLNEGIFADDQTQAQFINITSYMLTLSVVGMALASYFSAYKRIVNTLRQSETRFRTVIEQSPIGMAFGRDGMTLDVNPVYLKMFGYEDIAEVCGQPLANQIAPQCRDEVEERIRRRMQGESTETSYETIGLRKDGSQFPIFVSAKRVILNDGPLTFGFIIDITERKAAEEKVLYMAFYDQLTNLPNRRLLLDRLQQALASSARSGHHGALLFIDLDNFKSLNDAHGHVLGDFLLKHVSERLPLCVREGDTIARMGGDEFVVILEELSNIDSEAAAETEVICEKILRSLGQPFLLETLECHSTSSIGATLFHDRRQGVEELLKQAEIAMYQAKKSGRNTTRFFDPQMQYTVNVRSNLEKELHKAQENRQFQLHYQIQVDISGRPLGAESLIRWIHLERGYISPAQFIPLAEETGLILPIGQWVLDTACAQLKKWQQNPLTNSLVLSVNVSARQFHQADFVNQVQNAVRRHDISPMLLKLEITEGMLLENIEYIISTMSALRKIGVQFSLDDFGTGYSSLQYLKRLPLDQLKIDQSFVRDIAADNSDKAIVRTIIAMAHSLNLDVIAEGVETKEQQQLLMACGCTHFQGYLFSKPVPIEQFEALLMQD